MDPYILTSTHPTLDAVLACWLFQRCGDFLNTDVRFEHPDNPHPEILEQATVVCDVGNIYDPQTLRFSHHHDLNLSGAGKLVYQYLLEQKGVDILRHLEPIVELIDAEHTAKPHEFTEASRLYGLHALYQALSRESQSDNQRLYWGYYLLDRIERVIQLNREARDLVKKHTVYRSDDGAVVALQNVPQECHLAAFEDGAILVLFCNLDDRAIGCIRKNDRAIPHVGNLIADVITVLQTEHQAEPTVSGYIDELNTWFCHPAGMYAARGTNGFPSQDPIKVDIRIIAKLVDTAWKR